MAMEKLSRRVEGAEDAGGIIQFLDKAFDEVEKRRWTDGCRWEGTKQGGERAARKKRRADSE